MRRILILIVAVDLSRSAVRYMGVLEFLDESAKETLGEFRNFNLGLRLARDVLLK